MGGFIVFIEKLLVVRCWVINLTSPRIKNSQKLDFLHIWPLSHCPKSVCMPPAAFLTLSQLRTNISKILSCLQINMRHTTTFSIAAIPYNEWKNEYKWCGHIRRPLIYCMSLIMFVCKIIWKIPLCYGSPKHRNLSSYNQFWRLSHKGEKATDMRQTKLHVLTARYAVTQ
jgi:hypothetical protein